MNTIRKLAVPMILGIVILVLAGSAFASTFVLRGKVTDKDTGKPIVGAAITILNKENGQKFETKTNKNGEYIHRLPLARYQVKVKAEHYVPTEESGITYSQEGSEETIKDFQLAPGEGGKLYSEMTKEEQEKLNKEAEEYKKNAPEIEKARKLSGEVKQLFDEGMQAKSANLLDVAIDKFQQALDKSPNQPIVLAHMADCYFLKGENDKAIELYTKALEINPSDAPMHTNLGNIYVKKGMMAEAKAQFEAALKGDPKGAAVNNYNIGVVMLNAGNSDEALAAFQRCIEADKNYAPAYYHMAMCQVNKGDYKGAVGSLETYLKLEPTGAYAAQANAMLPELKKMVN